MFFVLHLGHTRMLARKAKDDCVVQAERMRLFNDSTLMLTQAQKQMYSIRQH